MTSKILLTVFSMMAELERDFVSERTKEGSRARKEQGVILGKPSFPEIEWAAYTTNQ